MRTPILAAGTMVLGLSFPPTTQASTYDEPWQDQVIREADSLVKIRIEANEGGKIVRFELLDQLAGEPVPQAGVIDDFDRVSIRNPHWEFHHQPDDVGYALLRKTEDGDWSLPTPSTGWAALEDGQVAATYRHSYHMALVPDPVYRSTTTALFKHLHGQPWDEQAMGAFIDKWLAEPPQSPSGEEQGETFFHQHVALECFHHLGSDTELTRLEPFLALDDFHVRVSAVRALSRIDNPATRQRLLAILADEAWPGFPRVMAAWGLERLDARELLPRLQELIPTMAEVETGFGGNIMDPRIGTAFPHTVKKAAEALVEAWATVEAPAPE